MSHDEFRKDFLQRCVKKLRARLKLPPSWREYVISQCLQWIEQVELSCETQEERLRELSDDPKLKEERLRELSDDPKLKEEKIRQWADEACQKVVAVKFILDWIQIACFLDPDSSDADQNQIAKWYQAEYADGAYRYLYARLIKYLGKREAENQLANAQDLLDKEIFYCEAFRQCVKSYKPWEGKKFENFLKWRIQKRVASVARKISEKKPPGKTSLDMDPEAPETPEEPMANREENIVECFYNGLREYLDENDHSPKAIREVAAYQLKHKAYLDPDGMLDETKPLFCDHLQSLKKEFLDYQNKKRTEIDNELQAAHNDCNYAMNERDCYRRALENEFPSVDLTELENQALRRGKTEMEKELESLGRTRRYSRQGLELQYMIPCKAWAKAKGKREKASVKLAKFENRQKPWIRTQSEIAALLGGGSQASIARYIKSVEQFMRSWLKNHG